MKKKELHIGNCQKKKKQLIILFFFLSGLFIIDKNGILRQITINDFPVGRSIDETLRLIQAFQFVDKHGEVCPIDWTPGKDTIKPSPNESKEFFKKKHIYS